MWPFGRRDEDKRVGFGRRPSATGRRVAAPPPAGEPDPQTPPLTPRPGGGFDAAIGVGGAQAPGAPRPAPAPATDRSRRAPPRAARRRPRFVLWVMGGMAFLFALIFIGVGAVLLVDALNFADVARRTTGEVVEVLPHRSDDGTTWSARLAYTGTDGARHVGETHISASGYDFARGERMAILYDPADPTEVRIDDWASLWALPVAFLTVGLVFDLGIAIALIVRARRRRAAAARA